VGSCDPLPDSCCVVTNGEGECVTNDPNHPECGTLQAICRTPGFWKNRGCGTTGLPLNGPCEGKDGAQNITQQVINACGGCLEVCGISIKNTALNSYDSAIEAMCDNPGKPIFHLTAMALNCCISGFGPNCVNAPGDLKMLFDNANSACAAGRTDFKDEVDCWNNGGHYEDGKCWYGRCKDSTTYCNNLDAPTDTCICERFDNCHDMDLCNEELDCNSQTLGVQPCCFDESKAAGSSKACTAAKSKNNTCSVFWNGSCNSQLGDFGGCPAEPD
jgi:hypothetical protein